MADESLSIEISARDLTAQAFDAVRRQLEGLKSSSAQTAKGVGDLSAGFGKLGDLVKGAGIAAAIASIANEIRKYHAETRAAAAAIYDQADAIGYTTDQFQAYVKGFDAIGQGQSVAVSTLSTFNGLLNQATNGSKPAIEQFEKLGIRLLDNNGRLRDQSQILTEAAQAMLRMGAGTEQAAAAKTLLGISGQKVEPVLRQLSLGMGELDRQSKAAGTTISGETVEAAHRLENQSKASEMAIRRFYAEIGMPIELKWLQLVEKVVGGIADAYARAQREEKAFRASAGERAAAADVSQLDDQIAAQKQLLAINPNNAMAQSSLKALEQRRAALVPAVTVAAMLRGQNDTNTADLDRLMNDGLPATGGGGGSPAVKSTGDGGGGGRVRDRIQEAINQLTGERVAAEKALQAMIAGGAVPLQDLERQVALEKKIADEIAKLGRFDPNDPRVRQIREQVIAHEQAETALKKFAAAARDADEIERRSGDGTAYLATETRRLDEALDTGRLRYEAYGEAMRLAREKSEDMRLSLQGQKGGVEGLVAGMQYAANQWERANRPFQVGQRLMTDTFQILKSATDDWAKSGIANIESFGQAMLNMVANVGFALAQSELMKLVGGSGGGGLLSLIFGSSSYVPPVTATTNTIPDIGSLIGSLNIPGNAGGGETPVGRPFWVGEQGPELMQMGTPGHVWNQDQLAGLGGGGGGAPVIHQTMYFGSDVNQATLRTWGERVKADTMAAIVADRRAGGVTKRVFS